MWLRSTILRSQLGSRIAFGPTKLHQLLLSLSFEVAQPKIRQHRSIVLHQHVVGLDVAVYDAVTDAVNELYPL